MDSIQKTAYSFDSILEGEVTRIAFLSFGKQLFMEENIEFLKDFEDYLLTPTSNKPIRAKRIMDLFIYPDSTFSINIPAEVQDKVIEKYKKAESGKSFWDGGIFLSAYEHVYL